MKITEIRYNLPIPIAKAEAEWWIFTSDWSFSALVDGLWLNVRIKAGCRTDLLSVPAKFQGVVNCGSSDPNLAALGIIHDILYRLHVTRREWADEFLEVGMEIPGLNDVDRWDGIFAFFAVHIAGSSSWRKAPKIHKNSLSLCNINWMEPKPIYGLDIQYKAISQGNK